jgi:hypothetical protein
MGRRELNDLARVTYRNAGEAIAGEQVIGQARIIGKAIVVPGTSTHRMQQIVLKSNVLCVIDRAFRLVDQPMRLKE